MTAYQRCVLSAVSFLIAVPFSIAANDKPDQSAATKNEVFVPGRGVIDDPSGYVNVLADKQPGAAIIENVKTGERVSFECQVGDKWCKVTLRSGKSGWAPSNRIKRYFTMKDLPTKGGDLGEANCKLARRAARKDYDALRKFLSLKLDGAAAEGADYVLGEIIHIIGDDAFADFLRGPPPTHVYFNDDMTYPFENLEYLRRHLPKTCRVLFPF